MKKADFLAKTYIAPSLKKLGFKKQNRKWKRARGKFLDIIQIEVSQWRSGDDPESLIIQYGVCIPSFTELVFNTPMKKFPSIADGVFRNCASGYILKDEEDIIKEGNKIQTLIMNEFVPILDSFQTYDDFLNYLIRNSVFEKLYPLDKIYVAMLYAYNNDFGISKEHFEKFEREFNQGWSKLATQVQNKLELCKGL